MGMGRFPALKTADDVTELYLGPKTPKGLEEGVRGSKEYIIYKWMC